MMGELIQLDEELLKKIEHIHIKAKSLVSDVFAGEYASAFKGRGMAFDEVREYQAGDDVRSIDWNVTARTNKPHIKVFHDERELTVLFMVDVSGSSRFGTQEKFKNEIAAEMTALLAYTALKSNDKVGLLIFSDKVEHFLPPQKGRAHIWRLIREILSFKTDSKKTNFTEPIRFLNQVVKRKAVVFCFSDFIGTTTADFYPLAKRHDLITVAIHDSLEKRFPDLGYIELEDSESGETRVLSTKSESFRSAFEKSSTAYREKQIRELRGVGADVIAVSGDGNHLDELTRYFRFREKRRKKNS